MALLRASRWRLLMACGAVAASSAGCSDARGRFQQFEARSGTLAGDAGAPADGTAGAGGEAPCRPPPPGVVGGPALLALETATKPGTAILFFGQVETPALDGATAVRYDYRALDAGDRRTQVGDALVVGPYAIGTDGSFDAPTAVSTLPGSANAILPGLPITSELTLHGRICGVADFYCGTVTGTVTAPIAGPTSGHFGLALLQSIDDVPTRPRFGCDDDALAPALEADASEP